jgi:pimeloyl-ACP methyl ester carboxylesterase
MLRSNILVQLPPDTLSLRVASGTLCAHRFGAANGPLTLCVHGLSANSRSFDFLAGALAASGRTVVALDLRGRGWSDVTAPGTYGWGSHAHDVLEAARVLGADRFDYVGHSMGAFVGMEVARRGEGRVGKIVLIDALGTPEAPALIPILAAVERLGAVHRDSDAYVAAVRRLGTVEPWSDYWETHYRYDLVPVPGGVSPRTDRVAVVEDLKYAGGQSPEAMWPSLPADSLLVRASRPLGGGFIVRERDRDRFLAAAPRRKAVDIDANHYGLMTHADTASAIVRHLS